MQRDEALIPQKKQSDTLSGDEKNWRRFRSPTNLIRFFHQIQPKSNHRRPVSLIVRERNTESSELRRIILEEANSMIDVSQEDSRSNFHSYDVDKYVVDMDNSEIEMIISQFSDGDGSPSIICVNQTWNKVVQFFGYRSSLSYCELDLSSDQYEDDIEAELDDFDSLISSIIDGYKNGGNDSLLHSIDTEIRSVVRERLREVFQDRQAMLKNRSMVRAETAGGYSEVFETMREQHYQRFRRHFGREPLLFSDEDFTPLDFLHIRYLSTANPLVDMSELRSKDMPLYAALLAFRDKLNSSSEPDRDSVAVPELDSFLRLDWIHPADRVFRGDPDPLQDQPSPSLSSRPRPLYGAGDGAFIEFRGRFRDNPRNWKGDKVERGKGNDYSPLDFLHEVWSDYIRHGMMTGPFLKEQDPKLYNAVSWQLQKGKKRKANKGSNLFSQDLRLSDLLSYIPDRTKGLCIDLKSSGWLTGVEPSLSVSAPTAFSASLEGVERKKRTLISSNEDHSNLTVI